MDGVESRHSLLKRIAFIVALAILLRMAIVGLYKEEIFLGPYGDYVFFSLPALELLALFLAVGPQMISWKRRDEIAHIGASMILVLIPNALLLVIDLIRLGEICRGPDYYKIETICEGGGLILQCCNIPFLLIGAFVLWMGKRKR
ncbi:MAG: hypothetical protein F4148_15320 [Caldilineaceae bacterium SB0675_bin_29]|uniref:Uncharacterized protein n=1 Tax=Caldilineaceae bacterium SB0675_bin_29 TaxID=2605266 RepID=A0A6B1G3N8_9CHLR|nr:hypothetical protein [Caldilineaceae bacterium SB0675_bin_29]